MIKVVKLVTWEPKCFNQAKLVAYQVLMLNPCKKQRKGNHLNEQKQLNLTCHAKGKENESLWLLTCILDMQIQTLKVHMQVISSTMPIYASQLL